MTSYGRRAEAAVLGEQAARAHLESLGYRTLETNFRTRGGELDIVASIGALIVFVEVKTRRTRTYGVPEESITGAKARRVVTAAQTYLAKIGRRDADWRIDVVAIELGTADTVDRIEVIENAVGL